MGADEPWTISVQKAAELTSLSEFPIYKAVENGEIQASRMGRRILLDYQSFKAWFAELPKVVESA